MRGRGGGGGGGGGGGERKVGVAACSEMTSWRSEGETLPWGPVRSPGSQVYNYYQYYLK